MKIVSLILVVIALAIAAPVFADGAFSDVPQDHWAYDAVNTLASAGLVQGYPDGTYDGKRAMSRYEFALAIARMLPLLVEGGINVPGVSPDLSGLASKSDVEAALGQKANKSDLANLATKADIAALKKLINEFEAELAALGVDVNNIKNQIAAIEARLDAIEAELKRVKINGEINVAALSGDTSYGNVVDKNNNPWGYYDYYPEGDLTDNGYAEPAKWIRDIALVRDFNLSIAGNLGKGTKANAVINFGNYLNYLGSVNSYVQEFPFSTSMDDYYYDYRDAHDEFFPYYMNIEQKAGNGLLTVGRFPLQLTPYTLKMVDVDEYVNIDMYDSGNYPVDGVKLTAKAMGIDWTLFAVKNDNNYYVNGLTTQPGLYGVVGNVQAGGLNKRIGYYYDDNWYDSYPVNEMITQSAGGHASINLPWKSKLGLTYFQAFDRSAYEASYDDYYYYDGPQYDIVEVMGADFALPIGAFTAKASANETFTKGEGLDTIDYRNAAYDYSIAGPLGKAIDVNVGWKRIGENYLAPGYWEKIGRWVNPSMIEGFYGGIGIKLGKAIKLTASTKQYEFTDDSYNYDVYKGDQVDNYMVGLDWYLTARDKIYGSWDETNWKVDEDDTNETYTTFGYVRQMSQNASLSAMYQIIEFNGGDPFGSSYKGQLGVVQVGFGF